VTLAQLNQIDVLDQGLATTARTLN